MAFPWQTAAVGVHRHRTHPAAQQTTQPRGVQQVVYLKEDLSS
jgi:hypothetical protein